MSIKTETDNHASRHIKTPAVDISVAVAPNDLESVLGLVQRINSIAVEASAGNENARLDLLKLARLLVQALETPREAMIWHCWAQVGGDVMLVFPAKCSGLTDAVFQPAAMAALSTGIDVGLFSCLAEDGGSAKNADQLATALGMDTPLLCMHLSIVAFLKMQ